MKIVPKASCCLAKCNDSKQEAFFFLLIVAGFVGQGLAWAHQEKLTLPLVVSVSAGLEDLEQPDCRGGPVSLLGPGLTSRGGLDSLRARLVPHPIIAPKRVTLSQLGIEFCLVYIQLLSLALCLYVGTVLFVICSHRSFWPLLRVRHVRKPRVTDPFRSRQTPRGVQCP